MYIYDQPKIYFVCAVHIQELYLLKVECLYFMFLYISDAVYVVCFSLILLSVDLTSPHIKNKMSKREFIRNTRRAAHGINDDFAGHLYDNIYLVGHVAPETWHHHLSNQNCIQPFPWQQNQDQISCHKDQVFVVGEVDIINFTLFFVN